VEELRDIREQLAVSRQMLDTVFDSTQATIFLVSAERTLIFFNRKANERHKAMYGRGLNPGDAMADVLGAESEIYRIFKANFEKALAGNSVTSERKIDCSQVSMWYRAEYHPFYEGNHIAGVALTITDITDQKRHELQIERQNELLREIAWMQSHQTRQPVATILGLINILDKSELGEKNLEIIRMLEQTTQRLDDVIRDTVIKANSF
jgi:signal transduction histidine kinase